MWVNVDFAAITGIMIDMTMKGIKLCKTRII
jgi:hypothetical protein